MGAWNCWASSDSQLDRTHGITELQAVTMANLLNEEKCKSVGDAVLEINDMQLGRNEKMELLGYLGVSAGSRARNHCTAGCDNGQRP